MNRFLPALGRPFRSKTRRARPRVEALADRVTPTVVVNGTPGDDVITARVVRDEWFDPNRVQIRVNGVVKATVRVVDSWSEPAAIHFLAQALTVNGRAGDDRIELGDLGSWTGGLITVTGGRGNDTLVGGNGPESLVGGPGADDLSGGLGEDTLDADLDDTRVIGGGGTDSLVMTGIRGTVAVTPTSLTLNGRTLSEADGTYSGITIARLSGSWTDDILTATGLAKVVLAGNGGNDRLGADASTDAELRGGPGNDTLTATGLVRGRLLGDGGDDRLESEDSSAPLYGGDGNDTLVGGAGQDWMVGGPGDDVLFGGEDQFSDDGGSFFPPANRLYGGPGNDVLHGGTKANVLVGGRGDDQLLGGAGADSLYGEQGDDSLSGGDGNDQLRGDGPEPPPFPFFGFGLGLWYGYGYVYDYHYIGADDLNGGAGNDSIDGDRADTRLVGGTGTDSLSLGRLRGRVVLTDTSLTINGRPVAFGGFHSVSLVGQGTADLFDATAFTGPVRLNGGAGNDRLLAGSGGSYLDGGPGADALVGGSGDDTLDADVRDRRLLGGGGFDSLEVYRISGTAVLTDAALRINGRRIAFGGIEDALLASVGESYGLPNTNDRLDASGFSGSVELVGGPGNDTLTAGSGGSVLDGQDGADVLIGGAGDDTLDAGPVSDTLLGNLGADTFVPDADATIAAEEKDRSDYNPAEGDTGY